MALHMALAAMLGALLRTFKKEIADQLQGMHAISWLLLVTALLRSATVFEPRPRSLPGILQPMEHFYGLVISAQCGPLWSVSASKLTIGLAKTVKLVPRSHAFHAQSSFLSSTFKVTHPHHGLRAFAT